MLPLTKTETEAQHPAVLLCVALCLALGREFLATGRLGGENSLCVAGLLPLPNDLLELIHSLVGLALPAPGLHMRVELARLTSEQCIKITGAWPTCFAGRDHKPTRKNCGAPQLRLWPSPEAKGLRHHQANKTESVTGLQRVPIRDIVEAVL